MTNGEMMAKVFGTMNALAILENGGITNYKWWDAEYKEALEQEPITKNNLAQERYQDLIEYFGDEKVSKIILENRGQFKAWLERLRWHVKRADELARELELLKGTTKNNLGVDCVSRAYLLDDSKYHTVFNDDTGNFEDVVYREDIEKAPSITPQPRKGHWIPTYGNVKCSVCGSVKDSRDVGKATHYCDFCGAKMESEE